MVAKSPLERIRAFARERGWRNLRLLSSASNTYNRDYYGEAPDESQLPSLNAFVRRDGAIHHFYHTELLFAPREPGQDGRHVRKAGRGIDRQPDRPRPCRHRDVVGGPADPD